MKPCTAPTSGTLFLPEVEMKPASTNYRTRRGVIFHPGSAVPCGTRRRDLPFDGFLLEYGGGSGVPGGDSREVVGTELLDARPDGGGAVVRNHEGGLKLVDLAARISMIEKSIARQARAAEIRRRVEAAGRSLRTTRFP